MGVSYLKLRTWHVYPAVRPLVHNPAMHWSEVWHGKSLKARLARTALTPISWLYACGWQSYLLIYKAGLKKPKEPHKPIVCVGNLTTGGAGKTPTTLAIAALIRSTGRQVVIGCSGYGSPHSEEATIAPEASLDPRDWGDEPAMIRWLSPDVPLIVGRNRVRAAELCQGSYPNAVLLMDDGFQHLPLHKHITIVLDPPSDNSRCIPAGPYREPRRNKARATLVMPGSFAVKSSVFLTDGSGAMVQLATASEVNVLCALGNPHIFLNDIKDLGLAVRSFKFLPDHDPLQAGNLFDSFDVSLPVVATAKDWIKLQQRGDLANWQILIARQEAHVEPEADFKLWLTRKLDELSIK